MEIESAFKYLESFILLFLNLNANVVLLQVSALSFFVFLDSDLLDNGCYRRNGHRSQLLRHVRATDCNLACNEPEISEQIEPEVGYFYEIDHTKLPPRSPIQLKSIRIVMVTEKTEFNVSVKFPSNLSLRTYFNKDSSSGSPQDLAGKVQPALDEQFVMGSGLASKIFTRQVPSSEILKQKHLQSFWSVPPKVTESPSCVAKERLLDDTVVKGTCWSALKSAGLVHWGVRRQVSFIGRHKEKTTQPIWALREEEEDEEEEEEEEEENEEEEEEAATEIITEETKETTRKRKRDTSSRFRKTKSTRKRVREKTSGCNTKRKKSLKASKNRWSTERYKLAEQKLHGIMKEKGAVLGQPMLRPALRQEARKHIGDTGLLDHLLKHMAGNVAPGGQERFRRRHNPEGAMEYWLESADLVNIRKEAGVSDSYWVPPPGWKPGDSPSQHCDCSRELNLLKEEIATLKRYPIMHIQLEQQLVEFSKSLNKMQEEIQKLSASSMQVETARSAVVVEEGEKKGGKDTDAAAEKKEDGNRAEAEGVAMQEEIQKLSATSMQVETARSAVVVEEGEKKGGKDTDAAAEKKKNGNRVEAEGVAKAEKKQKLRSGFRICKPQGTFLWPNNMVGSSNILSPASLAQAQVVVQVEDLLMVPTPPSVSSATSKPRLFTSVAPPLPVPTGVAPPPPTPTGVITA
ncbi:protein DYAD-like [Telopea speciosissima]|uniref:protein DYAD-like n=1 Tax=Telopea speciosissima TaxID=54955 RepID=UPI001CC73DF4|nr:protein DYAD-like [Telopea speciosissima]